MTDKTAVRPSRDGDQFHYLWAARQCLQLLPGRDDLVAVTIEGPSTQESQEEDVDAGEQMIDVGLYYGAEAREVARLIRYIQLKHSTCRAGQPWTAGGLKETIQGFAGRYSKLLQHSSKAGLAQRFRFEFTTNRPIEARLAEALSDLAAGVVARHPVLQRTLIDYTGLDEATGADFFRLFSAEGGEEALWAQRNLLTQELGAYLPDADYDAPVQLKELVTRKATSEFASNPSIRRHDLLHALKVTEPDLLPAPCLMADPAGTLPREQEREILEALLAARTPLVIHADGGVGKSVLAARLAASMRRGSEALLYDCFGDGLYRNALHFRHRHRDALVQMANELSARGLCHPLIPTAHADAKRYMNAFVGRLAQAIGLLRARDPAACLYLIVDAADNAEMAAEELREPGSFVRDLIRTPLPDGVRLAFTCRTHRRERLRAAPGTQEIELRAFSLLESGRHLRRVHPSASDAEVAEFAFLSSHNPRVQALALSRGLSLPELLQQLGPQPTTVERAINDLLESSVAKLRDTWGPVDSAQVDLICQGLAILRPLVPVVVLARLSGTSEGAVRSFALDLGRPLLLKGNSLHFLDEPSETWFRERFRPDPAALGLFLDRLRPLAGNSSYAAAALPQLLLEAGRMAELVELALTGEALPTENALERRDVELQRLTFALRAALEQRQHLAASKLALKAAGECAGEARQNGLIQNNTDLAATLMAPDRIDEIVSRRTFGYTWMGSHHAYEAALLSGRDEFAAEAASRLRMAMDWLRTWASLPDDEREQRQVSDEDRAELALALLRLRGPAAAADFLRRWIWRRLAFEGGRRLARRLVDHGRYDQIDALAQAAENDIWLLLGLAVEVRAVGRALPVKPLARLLRLLTDRRVRLAEEQRWDSEWVVLDAVRSAVELALQCLPKDEKRWAELLRRYLPAAPPSQLASRYATGLPPLLRAYALEFALRGERLALTDLAPAEVRKHMDPPNQHSYNEGAEVLRLQAGGVLPWFILSAEIACGRTPPDLDAAISEAMKATASAESRSYRDDTQVRQTATMLWLENLYNAGAAEGADRFRSWVGEEREGLWSETLTRLCRIAARAEGFERLALDLAAEACEALEGMREEAESSATSYMALARAILPVSPSEAGVFFNRAIEVASRVGDENLNRWAALLRLGAAAGERDHPRSQTAYRLARAAELIYEYVARDKHFDWYGTIDSLTDLCASSVFAIQSRWRDRRFGHAARLLPLAINRLISQGRLPVTTPIVFAGLEVEWERLSDLKRALAAEGCPTRRALLAGISYRYLRVQPQDDRIWSQLGELGRAYGLALPDIDRLIAAEVPGGTKKEATGAPASPFVAERRAPDWNAIFDGVDLSDPEALRAAHEAVLTYDPPYDFRTFFQEAFARVRPGREPELVAAITASSEFDVYALRDLLEALRSRPFRQLSLRKAVRDAVLAVCRRDPARVRRRSWAVVIPFDMLQANEIVVDADVVRATLDGFRDQVERLGSWELFELVEPLSACLSPEQADEALNFGLDLLEGLLKPEDGDGPWLPELQPPDSLISSLAGYVWAGLGSPAVAERWQFAHVVRSAVEIGWTDFLEALAHRANSGAASPFVDQGLEFYVWHARQWLLIALARGGIENAAALRPAIPLLMQWLGETHVLIRALAAQALRTLVNAGELDAEAVGDLDSINRPSLPERVYDGGRAAEDEEVGTDAVSTGEDEYYFGIDIGPYWFEPLGRIFGLSTAAIERRARRLLRQRMRWGKGSEWWVDARHARKLYRDGETHHSHGSRPETDDLRAYHAHHAMMLVAAELLEQRPVWRHIDASDDEFGEWLSDHLLTRADGRWLFDRHDPALVADPAPPDGYGDEFWCWRIAHDDFDRKLATDDGMSVLWGHWEGGEREHVERVSISSALVSREGAEALLAALQTAADPDRFALPVSGEMDDLKIGAIELRAWVSDREMTSRLDERDSWSLRLRYPGPAPSEEVVAHLGLLASADGRTWSAANNGWLRSETWTRTQGVGRDAEQVPGSRLSGDSGFLAHLLGAYPDKLMLLKVKIRRPPRRRARDEDNHEPYPAPYVRYYLMGEDGVAHAL